MKTKLVRIGNSRGVRIPKPLLEESGLEGEIQLRVVEDTIVIEAAHSARAGWAKAAQALNGRGESGLLDGALPTRFDEAEWEWD